MKATAYIHALKKHDVSLGILARVWYSFSRVFNGASRTNKPRSGTTLLLSRLSIYPWFARFSFILDWFWSHRCTTRVRILDCLPSGPMSSEFAFLIWVTSNYHHHLRSVVTAVWFTKAHVKYKDARPRRRYICGFSHRLFEVDTYHTCDGVLSAPFTSSTSTPSPAS